MEPDLIPYQALGSIEARRVLVLAPHPDDEVFGCGGALARHVQDGAEVRVIVMTAGGAGGDPQERRQESVAAAGILGYPAPEFWDEPDRGLTCSEALIQRLCGILRSQGTDLLYAPSGWEVHPDHRQASALAMEAVRRVGGLLRLAWYEVGAPLRPNALLDISALWPLKRRAMQCFTSQNVQRDYLRHIASLNEYRTYTLDPGVRYAEAFCLWTAAEVAQGLPWSRCHEVSSIGAQVPTGLSPARRVSILIRSVDRDSLHAALDSIATQTHPNLEVVVVAAVPGHRPLPARCGPHPLRLLPTEEALPRSRCANKALDHAQGELLMFLDDDDWLLPSHVERLAHLFDRLPGLLVGYTGIALVDEAGEPMGQVFDVPFDGMRLLSGNLMPLHAVLFDHRVLHLGCRFDESLDLYEDWDFWIQLSRHTVFAHLPGISGVYRIHASSGIHREPGPLGGPAQAVYRKWSERVGELDRGQLMRVVWSHAIVEEELIALRRALGTSEARLGELGGRVAELRAELSGSPANTPPQDWIDRLRLGLDTLQVPTPRSSTDALLRQVALLEADNRALRASTSWRITAPVRVVGQVLKHAMSPRRPTLVQRAWGTYRREGWPGVKARLRRPSLPPARNAPDYPTWCRLEQAREAQELVAARAAIAGAAARPRFSVLMPVYNPPLAYLDEAIRSVVAQDYADWELCIADDASPDPGVMDRLIWWTRQDARIKVSRRERNGHISEASNTALEMTTGDFIVLLDNDDVLATSALTWVAAAIAGRPDLHIVYSDEDKIDISGERFGPYFKSDWNYTLFLGHNLISHLGVYRASLVRQVGGFRKGFEGSQDYDLALRCIERSRPEQIVHVPRFLYHWRTLPGSTALGADEKPYALVSGQRALQEHLDRTWPGARVEILPTWNYRCLPPPLPPEPLLTLLLLGPEDPSPAPPWAQALIRSGVLADAIRCTDESVAVSKAIERAPTEFVALIDARLVPLDAMALTEMLGQATRPGVAAVGAAIYDDTERLYDGGLVLDWDTLATPLHEGLPLSNNGYMGRAMLTQELSAVSLRCAVVRRTAMLEAGAFYQAEAVDRAGSVQCCLNLRRTGAAVVWSPSTRWRQAGARVGDQPLLENTTPALARLRAGFGTWLREDPGYHRALDTRRADFTLRPEVAAAADQASA